MKERWRRLNKISAWAKKHTFLAACAFAILVCVLICVGFVVNYLCSSAMEIEIGGLTPAEFTNENFEIAVRQYLAKPEGDIYVEDLYGMRTLSLSTQPLLTDLTDLKLFPNLTALTISNCAVYDVKPVEGLQYLETLNLSRNKIRDISPLFNLERLKSLDVSNNNISEIPNGISRLTMLTNLDLLNNRISDVTPLMGSSSLLTLNLRGNRLTELPDMSSLKSLIKADFGNNSISSIEPVDGMESLQILLADGNLLGNIDFLNGQPTLIEVDLSYNDIKDISALTTCPKLESLAFYGVETFDLSPLEQLPRFNSLYLDDNFKRKGTIDFMFGRFKAGDRATVLYIISRNNMIEEY